MFIYYIFIIDFKLNYESIEHFLSYQMYPVLLLCCKFWYFFYSYSVDSSTIEAGVPGCVIRAIEGSMKRDDVTVKAVDQLTGVLTLVENEELVSNIVSITPSDPERKFQVSNCVKFDTGSCTTHIFFLWKYHKFHLFRCQKKWFCAFRNYFKTFTFKEKCD